MVKALYEEPERGYMAELYCSCAIEPATGRIVGVSVVHVAGSGPDYEHVLVARFCTDAALLVSWHLQMGVLPEALAERMHRVAAGVAEVGNGPGQVKFPIHRPGMCVVGLSSPLPAIVSACVVAHTDWRTKTAHLAQEGVVGHA